LQSVYGGDQVEVVSISEDDDEDAWRLVRQNQMNRDTEPGLESLEYAPVRSPFLADLGVDRQGRNRIQQYLDEVIDEPIIERLGPDLKKSLEGKS
jgi:hypothetical protein